MASAASSWVILGKAPRVTAADADADLPPGADLSLALPAPPRIALLTIPPRIFPGRTASDNYPSVVAVDPTGLILFHADQGRATGPTIIDTPRHQKFCWRSFVAGYFVLDATTASALPLPEPELILHAGHLGLISSPGGGGHYMVVELQPILGGEHGTLLRFSSDVGEWVSKGIHIPLPFRQLAPNGAVSY
ncbi:uncharacterized protein [Aegilops tauschii subsp. strangulata]|uniref:DUF1618 domain-containing protein n=1 Tax=Aegilops tauschii subsp. strangulata TaxID=200361 RepID=A0A453EKH2_AEGTS